MAQRYATQAEVEALVPELAALFTANPDLFAAWDPIAQAIIGLQRWGARASMGHALLLAHMFASTQDVATPGGDGGGAIASAALGPASISYAAASISSDDALAGTRYGQAFLQLRKVIRGRGSALVANSKIPQS